MLRHTTLLLIGIWNSKEFLVKNALEGVLFLFTGAEIWVKLARRSCSVGWTKPLQVFVKVIEGCLISNFASDPKEQFSLKNWRKTILKPDQWNTFSTGNAGTPSGATSCTATSATAVRAVPASGAHAEVPVW
jgi:hypothetical protein